ncbi:MAG: methylmalonyl-CoA mutase small subunit [Bacteroidaceae bacterium]|nr:methylmalonyl-CoA mutase small subunit [Bacteroidaceae bacterium]
MADSNEKLFSDFAPVTTKEWLAKINVDLKGADFEKKLVWKTNEGFNVQPFYRSEDIKDLTTTNALPGEFPFIRGTKKNDNTWLVRQDIKVKDAKEANAKALNVLMKGVDALSFSICGSSLSKALIEDLLQDIDATCVELNFSTAKEKSIELAQLLVSYFKEKNYDLKKLEGSIHFDPMADSLTKGKNQDFVQTAKELIDSLVDLPQYRCIHVDALLLNNAGAYISQELGYALAWGNEYLHLLTDAGLTVAAVATRIKFNFGISSNYFMEIAKFRAARMLWANIVKAYTTECATGECYLEACKMMIHAETSTFNMTLFDAHVNLLRSQTEAMSAALAGVHSMTVLPFDKTYKESDDFSERIARNQQLLLKEESHFDKVIDPSAGSYYIETLTASIIKQAWELFLSMEEKDGFLAAVVAGEVQKAINETGKSRLVNISRRKEVLLGTNQYPNFTEKAGEKRSQACCCQENETAPDFETLNFQRAASQFEALRIQTEQSGKEPVAFMLTIGNLTMRQARAQYACNFLGCAGYKVIDNLGFKTVEEGVEAAMQAKADIVVLCSSDAEYAENAIPAYKALNGRALFIVAGAPACSEELKAAGIDNFIHVRVNVLDTLRELNAKLGIK